MLLMKAWLETRWRLLVCLAMPLFVLGVSYWNQNSSRPTDTFLPTMLLIMGTIFLAGSGVKSQAPIGFPEGLAGSIYFTISLPVSRLRLLAVRAGIGLLETSVVTVIIGCMSWSLFPQLRGSATPADLGKFLLAGVLFLTGPYFVAVFFATFLDDPLPGTGSILTMALLLWLSRDVPAAVNIFRACGAESPLLTHRLPWSQMGVSAAFAAMLFFGAVRVVETREY